MKTIKIFSEGKIKKEIKLKQNEMRLSKFLSELDEDDIIPIESNHFLRFDLLVEVFEFLKKKKIRKEKLCKNLFHIMAIGEYFQINDLLMYLFNYYENIIKMDLKKIYKTFKITEFPIEYFYKNVQSW